MKLPLFPLTVLLGFLVAPVLGQVVNGDFENTQSPLHGWRVQQQDAAVTIEKTAGFWRTCTVEFYSGPYSHAVLYIGIYGHPSGRCWVDDVRPNGFALENPSFDQLGQDGKGFVGWSVDQPGNWVHADTDHVCDGKVSVRMADPSMAAADIRLWQIVEVQPHTEYSYTFQFFMDNDFYGALRCSAWTPDMMTKHLAQTSTPDWLLQCRSAYRNALEAGQAARTKCREEGRWLVDYWIGRLHFATRYIDCVTNMHGIASAELQLARADSDPEARVARSAAESCARQAVDDAREMLDAFARVDRNRSDRGAVAVMAEYIYRPLCANLDAVSQPVEASLGEGF